MIALLSENIQKGNKKKTYLCWFQTVLPDNSWNVKHKYFEVLFFYCGNHQQIKSAVSVQTKSFWKLSEWWRSGSSCLTHKHIKLTDQVFPHSLVVNWSQQELLYRSCHVCTLWGFKPRLLHWTRSSWGHMTFLFNIKVWIFEHAAKKGLRWQESTPERKK